ncbi:MAG: hypothetical protein DRP78_07295 [Candidatus Omnitrophota bacterium]|nr:MAG: hypothetical protein DRP78_07295 [Candidatus Omnitrophota bacterium]
MKKYLIIIFTISFSGFALYQHLFTKSITDEMFLMGSKAKITIVGNNVKLSREAMCKAFRILNKLDKMMSFFSAQSELAKINLSAIKSPVILSKDMYTIIKAGLNYSEFTYGAFDFTAASLGRENGYKTIILDSEEQTVYFADPRIKIDLGGIVVGYAIDCVVECFKELKITNFLIDVGGDIYVSGKNKEKRFWQIGIRNPLKQDELIEQISLINQAVTTSGNYLKQHIIDPKSKEPAQSNILSITVIAKKCIDADALATAFFVMGKDKTEEFLKKYPEIKTILVLHNGSVLKLNF